jgi:hypothetical protein
VRLGVDVIIDVYSAAKLVRSLMGLARNKSTPVPDKIINLK